MSCAQPAAEICPCGTPAFPAVVCNPPDLAAIAYRVGDYVAFRHALLRALPGEVALNEWRPGGQGDLAVQMVEWAAYIADILTFYNERIANEMFLGTALLPESVNHLVQLLGYRPRPALGARTTLAGLLTPGARAPVALPAGLQVQSKPGPGQAPQIFELQGANNRLTAPDVIAAVVVPASAPLLDGNAVWLAGTVTGIKAHDQLLLINASALATPPTLADYAWVSVSGTAPGADPLGNAVTVVSFSVIAGAISDGAAAADYMLLRARQASPLWSYNPAPSVVAAAGIHLAGIARGLTAGSLFLLDDGGTGSTALLVASYAEAVWYANGNGPTPPTATAPATPPPGIAIPHTVLTVASLAGSWAAAGVTLRWGFAPVGTLAPVLGAADLAYTGGATGLAPAAGAAPFPTASAAVIVEDAAGNAVAGASNAGAGGAISLAATGAVPAGGLASPMDVLFNLLPFTRGRTVAAEVLGSGNPAVAGQDFTLANMPVTYFQDPASVSGDGFSSTVRVSVNGVQWAERQSFYGQPANAQVFVLHEDDAGQTHVSFGDGVNGALLPTGNNNVTATYRYGAGAAAPAVETLTVVQTPQPGLKGFRNPLAPTGGADADAPADLRGLAPRSVLTFNRAVSLDDYAAIALTSGNVRQAVAGYVFDPLSQRPVVTLWVAGDGDARAGAAAALAGLEMPNQPPVIIAATPVDAGLSLTFLYDARYDPAALQIALTAALADPASGLFGAANVGIGQVFYNSQIEAACLAVPGVVAVHDVDFGGQRFVLFAATRLFRRFGRAPAGCAGNRHDPGAGHYFVLSGAPVLRAQVAA